TGTDQNYGLSQKSEVRSKKSESSLASPHFCLLTSTFLLCLCSCPPRVSIRRMNALTGLLSALAAFTIFYIGMWWNGVRQALATPGPTPEAAALKAPTILELIVGFVT